MLRTISKFWSSHQGKIVSTAEDAIKGVKSGDFLLFGGFGLCGIPMNLIHALSLKP